MLDGRCDCGAMTIRLSALPDYVNACPCGWCIRIGGRWGYLPVAAVAIEGPTVTYRRASRRLEFHRCATCGVMVCWRFVNCNGRRMGVQMANFDPDAIRDIPVVALA